MKKLSLMIGVCLASGGLLAQDKPVYKVVQQDGTILFSDTPGPGSEQISFGGITNNVSQSIATPSPISPGINPNHQDQIEYQVSIITPAPEATIRNNQGNITIRARATPAKAHHFELVFDNGPIERNSSGVFNLENIERGAHTYKVILLDNKGKTLASSDQQTLYLHQASALINAQGAQ